MHACLCVWFRVEINLIIDVFMQEGVPNSSGFTGVWTLTSSRYLTWVTGTQTWLCLRIEVKGGQQGGEGALIYILANSKNIGPFLLIMRFTLILPDKGLICQNTPTYRRWMVTLQEARNAKLFVRGISLLLASSFSSSPSALGCSVSSPFMLTFKVPHYTKFLFS